LQQKYVYGHLWSLYVYRVRVLQSSNFYRQHQTNLVNLPSHVEAHSICYKTSQKIKNFTGGKNIENLDKFDFHTHYRMTYQVTLALK